MPDGLSPELSNAVMKNGVVDYVKLAGIAKNKDNKLADEAGKLLQEALKNASRTETLWGDIYITVTQKDSNGNRIKTIFTDTNNDNIPDKITLMEYDERDNEIRELLDRDADGNPEEIHEREYYHFGDFSKIKKTVNVFDLDNDGKPDEGFIQEMDTHGNVTKSESMKFE